MSKYMDKNGTLRKEDSKSTEDVRTIEQIMLRHIKAGATVPEAIWALLAMMHAAIENVRWKWKRRSK